MFKASLLAVSTVVALCVHPAAGFCAGPDVIVGFVDDGREDSRVGTQIGLTASTNSCNAGDAPLSWKRLPDAKHPAITLNFYRIYDGRIEQLAGSWVKHGFYATNQNDCAGLPEVMITCQAGIGGSELRPGCSDYYGEDLNADPENLGPRSRISNPSTAQFDGDKAKDLSGYPTSNPTERILMVDEKELTVSGARYFVEAHYITADDALAGNARNNVSFREVEPVLRTGAWVLKNKAEEVRGQPAISAWLEDGAQLSEIEALEGGAKTFVVVGSKVIPLSDGKFRYEYVVYNMNSELAVSGFLVPGRRIDADSIGFKAVASHGEIWSNDAWQHKLENDTLKWNTKAFADDPNANAIRWGSTYNFWFVSDSKPVRVDATVTRFRTSAEGIAPEAVTTVWGPGSD
ncbi:hypothetical protein GGE68_002056 [Rhizobium leguminosarum]|uniref:hypothetical protein n=1 Tax=Rhizobium leguminosarum TaxID=384 RepID=UPI00160E5265|nr:hypothetical protein [Rhizobium leguminosarum]MBB5663866.1 hypothetical protein [Rhizobium leguminosarum]